MTVDVPLRRALVPAIVLIVTGLIGWYASFALTVDKILVLENPEADLDCNFSVIVQCGKNLGSWQGEILGFPNPLLGLGGFVAPIAVGVAILAGAQFARWFWIALNLGVVAALAFCIWLMSQSFFALATLCPWCVLVWAVTILMFWTLTLFNAKNGVFGPAFEKVGETLYGWVPVITFASYLVIAIIAQLRLDLLSFLVV
jgi:uncharacterized membrane protein